MPEQREYILGQSAQAARRLEIQDAHFAEISEALLDDLHLRPNDQVVELGCGAGSFSKRIMARLGQGGKLLSVDAAPGLLEQAKERLAGMGPARFEAVLADIAQPGEWLHGATVVVARTVLHHVPMAEFLVGKLRALLPAGTRVGFIEPDFRVPLVRLAYLQAQGRPELATLGTWAMAINHLYLANRISPAVGATLARAMEMAGFHNVRSATQECRSDSNTIENMLMFYDEVRDRLDSLGILTKAQVEEQQRLLRALPQDNLPAVWAIHRVAAST